MHIYICFANSILMEYFRWFKCLFGLFAQHNQFSFFQCIYNYFQDVVTFFSKTFSSQFFYFFLFINVFRACNPIEFFFLQNIHRLFEYICSLSKTHFTIKHQWERIPNSKCENCNWKLHDIDSLWGSRYLSCSL
jgi:hypothetical protein